MGKIAPAGVAAGACRYEFGWGGKCVAPHVSDVATNARRSFEVFAADESDGIGSSMSYMGEGRYRIRSALRERLPGVLAGLAPKGAGDCGAHEWYRASEETWRCYHCEVGVASSSPWTREEQLQHALGGINSTLRAVRLRGDLGGEEEAAELRRLVHEALSVLPEEENRLERLAQAPPHELPGLVRALRAG